MEIEVEAASVEVPAPRTRKPAKGKPRGRKPKVAQYLEKDVEPTPESPSKSNDDDGLVYGWPKFVYGQNGEKLPGFYKIMIFSDHNDGNKITYIQTSLGDHPKVFLAKNTMHVLPAGLVNNILGTTAEYPVDDLSDEMKPVRFFEKRARWPHSEPIPATAEEYVAYRKKQETLPHPNKLKKQ